MLQFFSSRQGQITFAGDHPQLMITGDRWFGLVWLLLKSKPSEIPGSRPSLVYTQNTPDLSHAQPFRQVLTCSQALSLQMGPF